MNPPPQAPAATGAYAPPSITPLRGGRSNKFGSRPRGAHLVRDRIEGAAIADLVERFGSPLFVFSERRLRRAVRRIKQAIASRWSEVDLAWSYKTNYLPAICRIMHQEGSHAEVVSAMEYEFARANGVPGSRIVYNGPLKTLESLCRAVGDGALINLDHLDEIDDLRSAARVAGRRPRLGIRINLDAGIAPQWSRFGFNLESGQAAEAVERLVAAGMPPCALHCHLGTYIMDPAAYERQVAKLVQFAHQLEDRFGVVIGTYDLGGGLPSLSRLRGTYLPPDVTLPPLEEYADRIAGALRANLRPDEHPRLVLEPGRAVVDEAGWLIASVASTKRLPDGTRAYVLDAGVNLLYTSTWYRPTVELERETPGEPEPSILYGPLCMNIDVVDEAVPLPPLERGQRLILSPIGAYNVTQWMQFIHYRPAVALIGEQGEVDVIRLAEGMEDVLGPARVPQRLAVD
jgi:diaminopimelate decarboxylase